MVNYIYKHVGMNRAQKRTRFVQDMKNLTKKPEPHPTKSALAREKSMQRGRMKIEMLVARGIKHNREKKFIFMKKIAAGIKDAISN